MSIVASAIGAADAQAQTNPPAEYPPASYTGKQYVDSKGCIYIRAGIDGNVNWVPRVSRSRKQLCGYQPTAVAGATSTPSQSAAPELITIPTAQQPTEPTPVPATPTASVASATAPAAPTPTKPQRPATTSVRTSSAPVPVRVTPTPPKPAPQSVTVASAPTTPAASDPCVGLSEISRQHMNQGARCGPQSSLRLSPNARVVPTHVYQDRRHSQGLTAPAGYRTVWSDGRLNLRRAERTLKPAVVTGRIEVPTGYVLATRDDDRLNTQRATRSVEGDAQTDMIWTRTVPRKLVPLPVDRPVITLPASAAQSQAEADEGIVLRLSTRSAPEAAQPSVKTPSRRYIRAATYADPAAAQDAAQGLADKGLPVRLGNVTRKGQVYKVVLAGPFSADAAVEAALARGRAAGHTGARVSK